jgi:hypothetical protein
MFQEPHEDAFCGRALLFMLLPLLEEEEEEEEEEEGLSTSCR